MSQPDGFANIVSEFRGQDLVEGEESVGLGQSVNGLKLVEACRAAEAR
jgi:hypothetical protein